MSYRLVKPLREVLPGSKHVSDVFFSEEKDEDVWLYAQSNGFIIISRDKDFYYLSITLGCPPKVIRVNCGNKTTSFILELVLSKEKILNDFFYDPDSCFLEISTS